MQVVSLNDFEQIKKLGEGSFGAVFLVKHKTTNEFFALKSLIVENVSDTKALAQEIGIGMLLKSEFIPKTYLSFEENDQTHILMEYVNGKDLFEVLVERQLSSNFVKHIIRSLLQAIAYCHRLRICHRDIKPENILVEDEKGSNYPKVKLIDWGMGVKYEENQKQKDMAGTLAYNAPELFKGEEYYCDKSDIWQVGIVAYVCLTRSMPFGDNDDFKVLKRLILRNKIQFPETVSVRARRFILRLTKTDPNERPSALEALTDPWIL